jgi:LIVCS family branched-chain amino acid:cation transporter
MKRIWKDVFVIGFALFSMFFGAGNVVFPPYLGLESGHQWFLGFLCYYLADIGLALLALSAILRQSGSEGITRPLGRVPAKVLMSAIVLCIGPMQAIPRTAAPPTRWPCRLWWQGSALVLFSVLFFAVIFLLCVKESAVVDIRGQGAHPGAAAGAADPDRQGRHRPHRPVPARTPGGQRPATGIEAGYQTMDVLAAMVFGIIVLKSAEAKATPA